MCGAFSHQAPWCTGFGVQYEGPLRSYTQTIAKHHPQTNVLISDSATVVNIDWRPLPGLGRCSRSQPRSRSCSVEPDRVIMDIHAVEALRRIGATLESSDTMHTVDELRRISGTKSAVDEHRRIATLGMSACSSSQLDTCCTDHRIANCAVAATPGAECCSQAQTARTDC